MPLGRHQVRALDDAEDLKALLRDISDLCRTTFKEEGISPFLEELPRLEAATPTYGLSASLFREGCRVRMLIRNKSSRPLELLEAQIFLPKALAGQNFIAQYQPVLIHRPEVFAGMHYLGKCLTVHPSTVLYLGVNPLKAMLGPGEEYVPEHLGVALPERLSSEEGALPLYYSVSSRQQAFGPSSVLVRDIPQNAEAETS